MKGLRILCGILFCVTVISCRQESGRASAGAEDPVNKSAEANGRAPRVILIRDGDIYIAELPDGEPKFVAEGQEPLTYEMTVLNQGEKLLYWDLMNDKSDEGDRLLLDLTTGKNRRLYSGQLGGGIVAPSPDGRWTAGLGADCVGLMGPMSLRKLNGKLVKNFYGKWGEFILQSVDFTWKPDSSRLYVLMQDYLGASPTAPSSFVEYEPPKMKSRDLTHYLPKGKRIGDCWIEEDGWIVFHAFDQKSRDTLPEKVVLRAVHPNTGKIHEVPVQNSVANAPGSGLHDRYFMAEGRLYYVQWEAESVMGFDAPPIASGQFHMDSSFYVPKLDGRDFVLIQRVRFNRETESEEYEIHLAPLGETETKIIFPGYQLGVLVD